MKAFASVVVLVVALAGVCLAAGGIVCPAEQGDDSYVIQFPSPTSCSEFYKCDRGVPVVQSCPAGLHYNARKQVCDYISSAHCTLGQ